VAKRRIGSGLRGNKEEMETLGTCASGMVLFLTAGRDVLRKTRHPTVGLTSAAGCVVAGLAKVGSYVFMVVY